jgi:hypothetical protein
MGRMYISRKERAAFLKDMLILHLRLELNHMISLVLPTFTTI